MGSRTSSRQGVGRLSRRGSLLSNSKQATSTSIVTVANAAKVRKLSNSSTNLSFNLPKQSSQKGQGSDSKLATEGSNDNECLKSSTSRPQSASQFQLEHSRTNIESGQFLAWSEFVSLVKFASICAKLNVFVVSAVFESKSLILPDFFSIRVLSD